MSENIAKLAASGAQPYPTYDVKQPFAIKASPINANMNAFMSQNEYLKDAFLYPSYRTCDYNNQVDKTKVFQIKGQTLEYKLDFEANALVSQMFVFMRFRNTNTDVTKNITHTCPIANIQS